MRAGEPRAIADAWVEPLKWTALAVWLVVPLLGIFAQPIAGRVTWTMAVAGVPIFIVLIGYHRWRRLCPLAFFAQLPAKLGRPGARRVPDFGEMAVLDPAPRSATVRAAGAQVTAVRLDGAAFQSALATDPAAAQRVLQTLVRRIRATERRVPT